MTCNMCNMPFRVLFVNLQARVHAQAPAGPVWLGRRARACLAGLSFQCDEPEYHMRPAHWHAGGRAVD
jgi:hypothetical protein